MGELDLLTEALRGAINNQELDVVYQPKFDMETERITGLEALLRWNRKDGHVISPDVFIPLAESTGLITPITFYVVEHVCRLLLEWDMHGIKRVPIAINISRRDLCMADFPERLMEILRRYRIDSRYIELEVTETAFVLACEQIADKICVLRSYGIKIAIDDFGTGYSSLACLKTLPLDVIKIDRVFMKDLATDAVNQSILRGTLDLARVLHLSVVYEGIETQEQMQYLKRFGSKTAQGFYYAGVMTKRKLEYWLTSRADFFPTVINADDSKTLPLSRNGQLTV